MSAPSTIVEWLRSLKIPWLVGGTNGSADVGAYGGVLDSQVALLKEAVKARMPGEAPSDALQHIGNDRGLIQGGSIAGDAESDANFGERLRKVWDQTWPFAGTPYAVLKELYKTLTIQFEIVQQNGLHYSPNFPGFDYDPYSDMNLDYCSVLTAPATPIAPYTKTIPIGSPWWRFDDKTDFCSRFGVFYFGVPSGWTDIQAVPTDTSSPTLSEVNTIRQIIAKWKNAEATCMGIYVWTSGKMWQNVVGGWAWGTGTWGGTVTRWDP